MRTITVEKATEILLRGMQLVREADEKIGHIWKMPSQYDCIRYAVTECAEAINDMIVLDNPDHARNKEQSVDVLGELRDTGMMLIKSLVAAPPENVDVITHVNTYFGKIKDEEVPDFSVGVLLSMITSTMMYLETDTEEVEVGVWGAVGSFLFLLSAPEMEKSFLPLLKEKLDRTVSKALSGELHTSA